MRATPYAPSRVEAVPIEAPSPQVSTSTTLASDRAPLTSSNVVFAGPVGDDSATTQARSRRFNSDHLQLLEVGDDTLFGVAAVHDHLSGLAQLGDGDPDDLLAGARSPHRGR